MFTTILHAYDGSDHAFRALKLALRIAPSGVRFRGCGHPHMTQSGHCDPPIKQKAPDATAALNWVSSLQLGWFRTFALCPCAALPGRAR